MDVKTTDAANRQRNLRKRLRWLAQGLLIFLSCLLVVVLLTRLIVAIDPFAKPREPTFDESPPIVGEATPDFTLMDTNDKPFHLAEQLGRRPLVLEFGSIT